MQEQYLFEYAVIRVMPRVEREEFLNVGVVLYCAQLKFLSAVISFDEERLKVFCTVMDVHEVSKYLHAFERICKGGENTGPIGKLPVAERFRWLTATRSTVVQTSKVHPGFCTDPQQMLLKLSNELVG